MLPRVSETVFREGQLQKEVIGALANPLLYDDGLPLMDCLKYFYTDFTFSGRAVEALTNVFPLFDLGSTGGFDAELREAIRSYVPEAELPRDKRVVDWAYGPWFPKVARTADRVTLIN